MGEVHVQVFMDILDVRITVEAEIFVNEQKEVQHAFDDFGKFAISLCFVQGAPTSECKHFVCCLWKQIIHEFSSQLQNVYNNCKI